MNPVEQTLDEVAHASSASAPLAPVLFVVFEADRPRARGARYSLVGVESVTLGRGQERSITRSADGKRVDVRVPGRWLSSNHAEIRSAGGVWIVTDAASRNGTFVNGERITSHVVHAGDVVEAGRVYFMIRGAPADDGPLVRDEDAETSAQPFGLRTLLYDLQEKQASLVRVARKSDVPILFLGETGSGKEVLAREAHVQSKRPGPFRAVNCGALPAALVESLLFGHVKGAFSGAARDEIGFVRSADGGTLFLDEIGDLPPPSQVALLRVLQEREVIPVGATRAVKVDVRIVAATHRPLEALSERGGFRTDLLSRLKGYTHRLLPMRSRMEDFGIVVADVLAALLGDSDRPLTFSPEAARAALAYSWPLNAREVHQAMASAVVLAVNDVIEAQHLPSEVTAPPPVESAAPPSQEEADALRDRLVALLHEHRGNVTAVARVFGKAPAQIHRWMKRLSIDPDAYRTT